MKRVQNQEHLLLQSSQGLEDKLKVLRGLRLPEEMANLEEGRRKRTRTTWHDPELIADFIKRVHVRHDTECWEWIGARTPKEYGLFYFNQRAFPAHRVAKSFQLGRQTTCECVCHICDIPWCVNPDHLYEGDKTTNGHDVKVRGGAARLCGEQCGASKLTNESVLEIRRVYASKQRSVATMQEQFGIRLRSIWRIISRETWKHI